MAKTVTSGSPGLFEPWRAGWAEIAGLRMKVGSVRLGIMGRPMATSLAKSGNELFLFTRSGVPDELLSSNGTAHASPRGVAEAFDRMKPPFKLMGKNITLVGDAGDGQTTKIANQIIVAVTIEAVAEALLLASRNGADPARVRRALMGGFASSTILEVHGQRMIERTFDPGFRIELHQKELRLALDGTRGFGLPRRATAAAQQTIDGRSGHGGQGWDHSAMVRALETLAGHEVKQTLAGGGADR